ncbi:cbb3-type cytochrome c oxidase N-terminal domain-containing protein [Botrimarina hoheduenensis]|uniref:Cbb3-type cytochrome c oxidase subunit CcoP2 n=1 Tax=Botrimarina hoheduenensis TaxID=2528000 RepID=A0A5C5VQ56_9BACT|nr:cbb3-type cytochrome c oxidase N-terminal domain-containing protein [Botrimarina hoheduenensis]TWT40768.1 Cbb3-type cytochrome c oxidase subunit CcoP2 [Botrimarina hoheduenensis]
MAEQDPQSRDENNPELAGHSYDGIQEYDNPTPRWWELLFVGSILFSVVYTIWFHSPQKGRTIEKRYEANLAANMRLQFGEIGDLTADEATILKYMNDEEWLKVGASTFTTNCVSCHGREGEGLSGPNLTDEHYLNVKQIADIAKVVTEGAKNGAMPAWGNRLHPNEIVLVSSYVASLRGQNETGPRPAEGQIIAPWPVPNETNDKAPDDKNQQAFGTDTSVR